MQQGLYDPRRERDACGVGFVAHIKGEGRVDMAALAARLGSMGIASILVEGGSRVLASAFKAGIVDKVCFFYAPWILGGDDGVPVCRGGGAERIKDAIRLERIRTLRFGDDVMIEGYVVGIQG